MSQYFPPKFNEDKFHCPHCNVYAKQEWIFDAVQTQRGFMGVSIYISDSRDRLKSVKDIAFNFCSHCENPVIWIKQKMVFPTIATVNKPNDDMPENIKELYLEASLILQNSPKGATALLRLALQHLMKELGEKGKNINDDIKSLVEKGLDINVQMALDYCRVVGNNAVHPGEINLDDKPEIANTLFDMLNFIVDEKISKPKKIQSMFNNLPQGALEAIEKRDNKS